MVAGPELCHVSPEGTQLPLSGTLHCDHHGSLHIHLPPSAQTSPDTNPHLSQRGISASIDGGGDAETAVAVSEVVAGLLAAICRRNTMALASSMY